MSESQAAQFDATWNVLSQGSDENGFSAVLLEDRITREKVLAIAGTNGISDIRTDVVDIGILGSFVDMEQFQSLEEFYGQLIGEGLLTGAEDFAVSGHSLGGFLAQSFAVTRPSVVEAAYTYNAPGFMGPVGVLLQLLGAPPSFPGNAIYNVRASAGFSITAGLGILVGNMHEVRIEPATAAPWANHYMFRLADSLALQSAFAQLDPTLIEGVSQEIFDLASNSASGTYESLLDSLRRMLIGGVVSQTNLNDRDALYENIAALKVSPAFISMVGSVRFAPLTGDLISAAKQSFSSFVALDALSTFLLQGATLEAQTAIDGALAASHGGLYEQWQADRSLSPEDRAAGLVNFSEGWLADRAAMMGFVQQRNAVDADYVLSSMGTPRTYVDLATGMWVNAGGSGRGAPPRLRIVFGTDENDTSVSGGTQGDRLYGGGGNDQLYGFAERDYLEGGSGNDLLVAGTGADLVKGGKGFDVYQFFTGDGGDTIQDADGGRIDANGILLVGGAALAIVENRNAWELRVGEVLFVLRYREGTIAGRGTLEITSPSWAAADSITITDFSPTDGRFGFTLNSENRVTSLVGDSSLPEGEASTIGVRLAAMAGQDQIAQVSIDPSSVDRVRFVNGAQTLAFNPDGTLNIALAAGQSNFFYSLVSVGDVDQDAQINIAVTLLDANGDPIVGSGSSLAITLDAVDEAETAPPTAFDVVHSFIAEPAHSVQLNSAIGSSILIEDDDSNTEIWAHASGGPAAENLVASGAGGADILNLEANHVWANGGDGNDWVASFGGSHTLIGGAGSDVIGTGGIRDSVSERADRLFGDIEMTPEEAIEIGETDESLSVIGDNVSSWIENSDDLMVGSRARDVLGGGGGSDRLISGAGNDLVFGDRYIRSALIGGYNWSTYQWNWTPIVTVDGSGVKNYSYELTSSVEFIDGTPGISELTVESSTTGAADSIYAGAGDDMIIAGEGDDFVDAGSGDDLIFGDVGNDTILGGTGTDILIADGPDPLEAGADFLDGGDGDDQVHGMAGDDVLYGGAGNDTLNGDATESGAGEDYLNGEDGDDRIWGGAASDTLVGGAGDDDLYGDSAETTAAGSGDDFLDGGNGNDVLIGLGGKDTLVGGADDDELAGHGGGGIADDAASDYLDGGAGNDVMFGWGGSDQLLGGDGDDQLIGDHLNIAGTLHGDDELSGGDGSDGLFGLGGDDTLRGDGGNDFIEGGDGDDLIVGGAGLDNMRGEAGDDTYVFDAGDFQVVGLTADGVDDSQGLTRLVFNAGLTSTDVHVHLGVSYNSINLTSSDGSMGVVIKNGLGGGLASVLFADGVEMSAAQLIGSRLDGNTDQISEANDTTLFGGSLDDSIESDGTNVTMSGGRGDDYLASNTVSSNTYIFARGDGDDVVNDSSYFALTGGSAINALALGDGIWLEDISIKVFVGVPGAVLELGADDSISMPNFSILDLVNGARTFDEIQLADGAILSWDQLLTERGIHLTNASAATSVSGTRINDRIDGSALAETIDGAEGDDTIDGGGGNDVLTGGVGSDTYIFKRGGGGDIINNDDIASGKVDRLDAEAGIFSSDVDFFKVGTSLLMQLRNTTDQVMVNNFFGNAGLDEIRFFDGTVFTAANVPWEDPPGNWFNYQRGDGNRTHAINDPSDGILDALRFGPSVDPASVRLSANWNGDLVMRFVNADGSLSSSDRLTFTGAVTNAAAAINQVVFDADPAVVWTTADQLALARVPTAGDDFIYGSAVADSLLGLAGIDVIRAAEGNDVVDGGFGGDDIYGGSGDDILRGGKGVDRLYGETGSDTFRIERGDAGDTIIDRDTDAASIDRLVFGTGILPADVRVSRSSNNLILTYFDPLTGSAVNTVTVNNYYTAGYEGQTIDEVRFVDAPGIVWQRPEVLLAALQGGALNDGLGGYDSDDVLRGMGGNDFLNGLLGNDDLDGGTGNDSLHGGQGNDTYRFDAGGGSDTITEAGGTDRIVLASGISTDDVQLYRQSGSANGDLVLVLNGGQNQLRVLDAFNASGNKAIESIEFAGGTVWDAATIAAQTNPMGASNSQTGGSSDDMFVVDHVNDLISESAAGGVDTVLSSVSFLLPTNVENLTLTGVVNTNGTGNELANVISGNTGSNVLDGGAGVDTMIGGVGDDTYVVDDSGGSSFGDGWADGSQDVVQENAGEGYDTVLVSAYSDTLHVNVERLVAQHFTGNFFSFPSGADLRRRFVGNDINNVIDASALLDGTYTNYGIYLDGGLGADTMIGGETNETYIVDNSGDLVVERGVTTLGSQTSTDIVLSSVTFALPDNVENLTLTGISATNGTGNELNNVMDGASNTAANILAGGDGDDTYRVGAGDSVTEGMNAGTDTVRIAGPEGVYFVADYTNVEYLVLENVAGASTVVGDAGNNHIQGNSSFNLLQGGAGNDEITDGQFRSTSWNGAVGGATLQGGDGNDTLYTAYGWDTLDGGAGNDWLADQAAGISLANTTYIFGRGYDHDTISATESNWVSSRINLLAGVSAPDVALSRDGVDLLLHIAGDSGSLRVLSFFTDVTGFTVRLGRVQNIDFADGTTWDRTRIVNLVRASSGSGPSAGDDVLFGTSGNDVIDALGGNDMVYGSYGDDNLTGGDGVDELFGDEGNDTLTGGSGDDTLRGNAGNDVLVGEAGADTLIGGPGADSYRFAAGSGTDVIIDSGGATEDASIDEVVFETGIVPADIELRVGANWPSEPDLLIRNTLTGDEIRVRDYFRAEAGFGAGDHIEQIRFADGTVWGAEEIRNRAAEIVGTEGNDVLQAIGSLSTRLIGLGGDDLLVGHAGNDVLDGGTGADEMEGGAGNDIYEVDSTGDSVFENTAGGLDLIRTSVGLTLGAEVENLTLLGTSAINGTGNSLSNVITGNAGNNTLNGGAGTDTLIGGAGDDTYEIDATDVITENPGEGTDLVRSAVTHSLAADFENLTLTGTSIANATGNDVVNVLVGNSGANVINGGLGADDMTGGSGNDTFVVDNVGDIVRESSNGGTDTIQSSVTLTTLAANVEHVTLTGSANINAVGGSGNNTLAGNIGNNVLDGMAGTDTLIGGLGDDIYIVNSTTDTITELAGGGSDTVSSSVTFSINTAGLQNVIENLTLTGTTANTVATGNALANVLIGTSVVNTLTGNDGNDTLNGLGGNDTLNGGNGNDTLDGGAGNDGMTGGAGDDIFFVDSTTDVVTEASGGGTDTIRTSLQLSSWAANVENMTMLGTGNLNSPTTTSSANNVLVGNSGNNTLNGGAGNDTINGAGGTDALTGGTGTDIYQYHAGGGTDTIDNASTDALIDRLQFLDLASNQVAFSRSGNNLVMTSVAVSTDKVTVTNWFSATANRLDFVNFTNVEKTAAQIDALVAGGGGSFPLSAPPPAAMRVAPESAIGGDFTVWGEWNGGEIGGTTREVTELAGKTSAGETTIWRPIKSFTRGDAGALTLGGKSSAESQYATLRPIKSFARDEVGVERLIDAMTRFGVERAVDAASHVDRTHSEALELLTAHARPAQVIRAALQAAID
jgi:Ca2+-binding RTX toxin-like protein